ncbi:MAG: ABC transporter permease [Candidatus Dormiibacterota bacterium]
MNSLKSIRLIAGREISERLGGRATWILTGITTVGAVALIVGPTLFSMPTKAYAVGLVGPSAQALAPTLLAAAKALGVDMTTMDVSDDATARSELTPKQTSGQGGGLLSSLRGGSATLDVALRLDTGSATIEFYQTVSPTLAAVLRAVVEQVHQRDVLTQAGVSPSVVGTSQQPEPISTVTLKSAPSDIAGRRIAALAAGILLFFSVGIFCNAVASGVAQEKTSRTAEVLLAAVTPSELMTGKVIGIGLVGFAQMAITIGAALLANAVVQSSLVPSEVWVLLPAILLWFVLGYALYAFGYAAAGAMVARQEEVQSVGMPFTVFLVGGYLLMYATIASPDSPWVRVVSYVPPLMPALMPARLALGQVAIWEMPLAVLIMLASIYGMARLAGRIYATSLVRGGPRLSWIAVLRLR